MSYLTICLPTDDVKAATRHLPGQALFWLVSGFAVTKNLGLG